MPEQEIIPERIISLTPSLTEILFALGLGSRVSTELALFYLTNFSLLPLRKISYGAPTCFEMFSVHQIPSILALTREKAHDTNLFLLRKAICHIGCSNCRSRVRHNWGIVSSRLLGATFLEPL
jgi:hypothetical protein